jgi:hypothetical protein
MIIETVHSGGSMFTTNNHSFVAAIVSLSLYLLLGAELARAAQSSVQDHFLQRQQMNEMREQQRLDQLQRDQQLSQVQRQLDQLQQHGQTDPVQQQRIVTFSSN